MPSKPTPVAVAEKSASIPKRPVIQHTKLLQASLHASERDREIEFAQQKFDAIREGLDAERADIITSIDGIEAALKAMSKEHKEIGSDGVPKG